MNSPRVPEDACGPFAALDTDLLTAAARALQVEIRLRGAEMDLTLPTGEDLPPERAAAVRELLTGLARTRQESQAAEEHHDRLEAELLRRRRDLDLLYRFSREAAGQTHARLEYEPLLNDVAATLESGYLMVSLMIRDFTYLKGSVADLPGDTIVGRPLPWEEIGMRLLSGCLQSPDGVSHMPPGTVAEIEEACGSPLVVHCIPVHTGDRPAGFVALLHPPDGEVPTQPPMLILEGLANHIGQTLGSVQLESELHGFLFDTAKSLVAAVDAKDPYTRGHSERVHYLAVRAGQELGLDPLVLRNLSWAALLHDIGKIGIPESLLCKSGTPTEDEWRMLRSHPDRGCRVIEPIPQLADALPGIRHHHEQFQGGGYPADLVGDQIPYLARIICVADAFDAITSNRPYTAGSSCQEALAILARLAGTKFDPEVVLAVSEVVRCEIASGSMAFEALRREAGVGREAG